MPELKGFAGGIQQFQNEKKLLRDLCNLNDIDLYLEIGTLWGGTAIIAALAGAEKVITIDSMDGIRWSEPDPFYPDELVTKERILRNFYEFGVEDIIELIHAKSYPFPPKNVYPDITLIDGGHNGIGTPGGKCAACMRGQFKDAVLSSNIKRAYCRI